MNKRADGIDFILRLIIHYKYKTLVMVLLMIFSHTWHKFEPKLKRGVIVDWRQLTDVEFQLTKCKTELIWLFTGSKKKKMLFQKDAEVKFY